MRSKFARHVTTNDGREWVIIREFSGGAYSQSTYRLMEIVDLPGQEPVLEEHDAVDGAWTWQECFDYLKAVGDNETSRT